MLKNYYVAQGSEKDTTTGKFAVSLLMNDKRKPWEAMMKEIPLKVKQAITYLKQNQQELKWTKPRECYLLAKTKRQKLSKIF